jgi:hypothetical protein
MNCLGLTDICLRLAVVHFGYLNEKDKILIKNVLGGPFFGPPNKKENKKMLAYLLNIAIMTLMIAPTTTTQPAITLIIPIIGTAIMPSISAKPTAKDTMIPTIHVIIDRIPVSFFAMFTSVFS